MGDYPGSDIDNLKQPPSGIPTISTGSYWDSTQGRWVYPGDPSYDANKANRGISGGGGALPIGASTGTPTATTGSSVPWWQKLIAAGAGGGGGTSGSDWFGKIFDAFVGLYGANKSRQAAKEVSKQQDRLYGIQADTAEMLQPYALDFYRKSREAIDPALGYYRSLASGDSSRINSALAPQLASIGQRYRSLFNASSELNQRGGMSASYGAELPFEQLKQKQALKTNAQQSAYGNLASLFGQLTNAGAGAAGGSQNAAAGATGMLNNAWLSSMLQSGKSEDAYAQLGKALGGWFKSYQSNGTPSTV